MRSAWPPTRCAATSWSVAATARLEAGASISRRASPCAMARCDLLERSVTSGHKPGRVHAPALLRPPHRNCTEQSRHLWRGRRSRHHASKYSTVAIAPLAALLLEPEETADPIRCTARCCLEGSLSNDGKFPPTRKMQFHRQWPLLPRSRRQALEPDATSVLQQWIYLGRLHDRSWWTRRFVLQPAQSGSLFWFRAVFLPIPGAVISPYFGGSVPAHPSGHHHARKQLLPRYRIDECPRCRRACVGERPAT